MEDWEKLTNTIINIMEKIKEPLSNNQKIAVAGAVAYFIEYLKEKGPKK